MVIFYLEAIAALSLATFVYAPDPLPYNGQEAKSSSVEKKIEKYTTWAYCMAGCFGLYGPLPRVCVFHNLEYTNWGLYTFECFDRQCPSCAKVIYYGSCHSPDGKIAVEKHTREGWGRLTPEEKKTQ